MALKDTLETFLLPWEKDKDGKKLETPRDIDVEKLRKWVFGLLADKDQAQEARDTAITERENARNDLKELQTKNESEEQRRAREEKERQKEIEDLRKSDTERKKIDILSDAFPEATSARIKKLAKRVTSTDEKDWVNDAKELVEDGFRITEEKKNSEGEQEQVVEETDDLSSTPRVVRNGKVVQLVDPSKKPKSVADELDAAGIGRDTW